MKRNFVGYLFGYRLRLYISLGALAALIFIFGGGFVFKLRETIKVLNDIQSLTMPTLGEDEVLTFQNSHISVIKQKGDGLHNYITEASVKRNVTEEFSFRRQIFYKNNYKMEGLEAKVWLVRAGYPKEAWLERYEATSDFINIIGNNTLKLYGNVGLLMRVRQGNTLNKATMSMVLFEAEKNVISGYNLVFRHDAGMLKSGTFSVFLKQDELTFAEGVEYENKEYKIASKSARLLLEERGLKSLFLRDSVRFEQLEGERTVVFGKTAQYEKKSGKLVILGDVKIVNQARNAVVRAERFVYDEVLKKGVFEAGGNSEKGAKKRVEVEIEI